MPASPSPPCLAAAALLLVAAAAPRPGAADEIHFTSGRSMIGIVLEETDTSVRLETEKGVVGIPWSAVASIDRAAPEANRALRRRWAEAQRVAARERRTRRAQRRAREAAAAQETPAPGTSLADAARAAQAEERWTQEQRRRISQYQDNQRTLAEDERNPEPIVFQHVVLTPGPAGYRVEAHVLNTSGAGYRNVAVEVALVQDMGTETERTFTQQTLMIPELPVNRIEKIALAFGALSQKPVRPRLTVRSFDPAP